MATNGNLNHTDQYAAPAQTTEAQTNADGSPATVPKDEVAWYFVEQYYTTMSKSPVRLHLYYGKKSQFVCGREAEVVNVSFGRQAIQERIQAMDFQDCKVRISNVDTQVSNENILITVIGEMANREGEPKKYIQTFVLAQQPSGYFVLNDMLRFLSEDTEEEEAEVRSDESAAPVEMPAASEPESKMEEVPAAKEATQDTAQAAAQETAQEQEAPLDTEAVTEKLEAAESPSAIDTPATEPAAEAPEPAAAEESKAQPDMEKAVEEIAEEEVKKPEEPKDPAPTPAAAPAPVRAAAPAPAPAQPEKAKEPPKPMSWASRAAAAAAAAVPTALRAPVAVPVPKIATPPAPAQPRAPVPAAPQQAASAAPAAQPQETAAAPAALKDQGEWQTAETKRQGRAQPAPATPPEKEGTMAYIKYVTDKVKDEDLKATLTSFGELAYFDINRLKNCAFVEFKTPAGYNAAVAANPHTVNGENIVVEQRRPKANAYGGSNYSTPRGGGGRGGRGGFEPSRSGSQSGRGGFSGQSRGRGGVAGGGGPRGRGVSQVGAP
ncbi:hypothetical protein N658DRAFT_502761 [Parathielavia hyrcaniae]|uniref:Uncharacterized protein n=1 Tax=Parathielavia hyrcaniae TaxID=113614 RepID=A0AAN6Q9V6_9PEZI|nr:hypothetical protein N658DRAFT_502761 [Parathielavia hyrcaniae]